jgi:hypothetical protein
MRVFQSPTPCRWLLSARAPFGLRGAVGVACQTLQGEVKPKQSGAWRSALLEFLGDAAAPAPVGQVVLCTEDVRRRGRASDDGRRREARTSLREEALCGAGAGSRAVKWRDRAVGRLLVSRRPAIRSDAQVARLQSRGPGWQLARHAPDSSGRPRRNACRSATRLAATTILNHKKGRPAGRPFRCCRRLRNAP